MSKSRAGQRQSRLTNPVVATTMYEALVMIGEACLDADNYDPVAIAKKALAFVRSGKETDVDADEN